MLAGGCHNVLMQTLRFVSVRGSVEFQRQQPEIHRFALPLILPSYNVVVRSEFRARCYQRHLTS